MKSGSGDDPFADMDGDEEERTEEADDSGRELPDVDTHVETGTGDGGADDSTAAETASSGESSLPWRYARDSAKDGRDMVQFFLQADTQTLERRAQTELEEQLGEDVLLLDAREAAYQVALEQHLDDVAEQLREWGYDPD